MGDDTMQGNKPLGSFSGAPATNSTEAPSKRHAMTPKLFGAVVFALLLVSPSRDGEAPLRRGAQPVGSSTTTGISRLGTFFW
jgi:hypothetical protein